METFYGMFAGGISNALVHPLDTLKTISQTSNLNFGKLPIKSVFRGIIPSTCISSGSSAVTFGLTYISDCDYYKTGLIAGFCNASLLTPFEYLKIQYQINNKHLIKVKYLYRGYYATIARDMLGNSLYFGTYEDFRKAKYNAFLSGACAGIISWLFTYPIDVLKSRIQGGCESLTYYDVYKRGNLWNGLYFCLFRASIANGLLFSVYDILLTS